VGLLHVGLYWYPFTLDPPRRVDNTARRLADGAWELDAASRVTIHLRGAQPDSAYSIAVKVRPAHVDQTGPARLVSVGSNPYEPSLMLGLDHADVVVRLPCADGENDAEWRVPRGDSEELTVTFWPLGDGTVSQPLLAVDGRAQMELQYRCPIDLRILTSLVHRPWTLGNVRSGHRPFVGRVTGLEFAAGEQRLDLLRDSMVETPASYWIWPERLFQPDAIQEPGDWVAVLWHFLGFLVIACLLESGKAPSTAGRTMLAATAFSATLFAGKLVIVGRHPSISDVMLNLGGAATGILLYRRFVRDSL
jgi:VanZ family protein